jgi:hypothetical protein
MTGRTMIALAGLLMAAVPATALAQNAGAAAQARAAAVAQTPEARIDAALRAAAQADVPVSLLESKVAEGRAKRVPAERIAAAVEARLTALIRAGDALRRAQVTAASQGELAVTADALEAGVSESALIRVTRSAPAERRVVAIAVLADLVRLGTEPEPASTRVSAAVSTSTALANLHAEVAAQLRLGGLTSTLEANGIIRIP